jgi:parallel beta-helix repeat protein
MTTFVLLIQDLLEMWALVVSRHKRIIGMDYLKAIRYLVYFGMVLCFTHSPGSASTYYVSTTGNNENPGTFNDPWRTIQKAADTMNAGDLCIIYPGDYDERVSITTSGSPGNLITYVATGDTVKTRTFYITADYIRVQGITFQADACSGTWGYGIKLTGDHCFIEDNYSYYCPKGGIRLTSSAEFNIIKNNDCYRNGLTGIEVDGSNNVCEYNEIWGSIVEHTPTGCINEDCDGIRFFGTGHVFRGNHIHDIKYSGDNEGHDPHIDGFQTFWWSGVQDSAQDCTFEYNFIDLPYYKSEGASAKGWELEDSHDLTIRYNVVRGNWGVRCEARNTKILNNTFYGESNLTAGWQVGVRLSSAPGCTVYNNIIVDFDDMAIETTGTNTGSVLDYNCTYMSDESTPGGNAGPHDLWGVNPLFENETEVDCRLKSESPCIDAGSGLGESHDDGVHPESVWPDEVLTLDQDDYGSGWEMGVYVSGYAEPDTISPSPPTGIMVDPDYLDD